MSSSQEAPETSSAATDSQPRERLFWFPRDYIENEAMDDQVRDLIDANVANGHDLGKQLIEAVVRREAEEKYTKPWQFYAQACSEVKARMASDSST